MTARTTRLIASEARSWFERATRDDSVVYYRKDPAAPEWVTDLALHAHGDMLPDDWRYEFIVEALDALAETEDPDEIQLEADVYNTRLIAWLGSHSHRAGYCDEAREEFSSGSDGIIDQIMLGQYAEKQEVLGIVRAFIEQRAEDMEDADEGGES